MSRLNEIKDFLQKILEKIQESDAYQQLKSKYDELDAQAKLIINLSAFGAAGLFLLLTVLMGIAKVNSVKSDLDSKEKLIGYLQRSSDRLNQLRSQQLTVQGGIDASTPIPELVDKVANMSGVDSTKLQIGTERSGQENKEAQEFFMDIKINQINVRQLTTFLYNLTEQGTIKKLNIKDLTVDTKGTFTGYIDANVTIATYKVK